jgi:hypothetical protein
MPVLRRRAPRWLILALAVPVIAAVYLAVAGGRLWSAGRGVLARLLGATVIGSVYVEFAARQAVIPARRQPLPLTIALAIAVVAMNAALPAAPTRAASDPAETVVQAALAYKGAPYVWGAEGPDTFDCSGLVYRAFKDAGELPLISGRRLTAYGYYVYFSSRGMASMTDGKRGDLVVYGHDGHIYHIGIYLGNDRVLSALNEDKGVVVHGLYALTNKFKGFLHVPWSDSTADTADQMTTTSFINKVPEPPADATSTDENNGQTEPPADPDVVARGYAFGSVNVRDAAGPDNQIVSWVSRGTTISILAAGRSPGGALWYKVRKASGKEGWVWSGWVRIVSGSVDG